MLNTFYRECRHRLRGSLTKAITEICERILLEAVLGGDLANDFDVFGSPLALLHGPKVVSNAQAC